ncbi:hypothetical protein ASE61_19500 [Bosea sp. Root670]|uniref:hypothetical protein n=1 Tax=Bosea sp. Root670 TaxID=1736583 RepID=UPI0007140E15|nr:hypothetical protein [Bosea sp. Root670]KRE00657.1 hypothetical protein ASE61_19500 [Bosea sp. Root670]
MEVVQFRRKTCRGPLGLTSTIRQVASGVDNRLPLTMKAGAKALAGCRKPIDFGLAMKTLGQDAVSSSQAPWKSILADRAPCSGIDAKVKMNMSRRPFSAIIEFSASGASLNEA